MSILSPAVVSVFMQALDSGVEVTLASLLSGMGGGGMTLERLDELGRAISSYGLFLAPPISQGNLDTPRVLGRVSPPGLTEEVLRQDIERGESSGIEFKASLLFDRDRARQQPHLSKRELRSDSITLSALRAIASFMNCGGGVLYIGVTNEGDVSGLADDCQAMGCSGFDKDRWELHLRDCITGKMKDGKLVGNYIETAYLQTPQGVVARLRVSGRRSPTFLMYRDSYRLFARQGNRSVEVSIDHAEEFFEQRRAQSPRT